MNATRSSSVFGLALMVLVATLLVGCRLGVGASPSPTTAASPTIGASTSPNPTPTSLPTSTPPATQPSPSSRPPIHVSSAAQAAALVLASNERYAHVGPLPPDLVGATTWYEASLTLDGFSVAVTLGSGDCEAGCIDKHTWTYHVDYDGTVTLTGDTGDSVEYRTPTGLEGPATLTVHLVAGPVCPVERVPPDPSCAPRPVVDGEIVVYSPGGVEVARGRSDDTGTVSLDVPGGAYYVEALPVDGLMRTPEAQAFSVPSGGTAGLLFGYDTGIR